VIEANNWKGKRQREDSLFEVYTSHAGGAVSNERAMSRRLTEDEKQGNALLKKLINSVLRREKAKGMTFTGPNARSDKKEQRKTCKPRIQDPA